MGIAQRRARSVSEDIRSPHSLRPSTDGPRGLEDFAFMRRVGTAMFLLGAITLLATLSLPDPDPSDHTAIEIIAGLLALGAVYSWVVRIERHLSMRLSAIYGIVLVSALMAVTRPIEATPFFYLWPMLFSAYFFSRRDVAIDLVVMWVTLGAALFGWSADPMKQVMFMGVGVSVSLTAIVVMLLREHLTDVISQLARASHTDHLTGLVNRRAFDARLQEQIVLASGRGLPLSIVVFDLDHFKRINDRFGHPAGDEALCEFAALLAREQRSGDTLARIGGEEFAVILSGAHLDEAIQFAERIGAALSTETASKDFALSTSAGVAARCEAESTPSALLVAADRALYGAKAAGRSQVAAWKGGTVWLGDRALSSPTLPDGAQLAAPLTGTAVA